MKHGTYSPATVAVAAGRPAREPGAPVNQPITLSSTYVSQGEPPADGAGVYTRWDTDAWHAFEEALGLLEHATLPALVFASGMAAISACYSLLPRGFDTPRNGSSTDGTLKPRRPVIVVPKHAYHASLVLADELTARLDAEVRKVDIGDTDAVIAAFDGADLALIESPTNPMLEVADLPMVLKAARAKGVLTIVDNTFATPLGQNPLDMGADIVLHSVTKYLAGHSDVVLGAVVTNDAELRARLFQHRVNHGAIAGPFEVWLALRGLRTLALRVERSQANARELVARLGEHPNVVEVRYPRFGSIIGLRPIGGQDGADKLVAACQLWVPATSLGGVESSLERRRRFASEAPTVPVDFLRLSVGIEDVEDLWQDLDQALRSLKLISSG